jgi:hypothetical protein
MEISETSHEEPKPVGGWACVALSVGFVVFVGLALVGVRLLAG